MDEEKGCHQKDKKKSSNILHGFRASKLVESSTATMNSISRACIGEK